MNILRLRIESPPAVSKVLRLCRFPIRIGRDPECECRLDYAFVSRLHATLDLRDGRLVIRDEQSRTGTRAANRQRPLAPKQWVDLESIGGSFSIGPLDVYADLIAEDGADVPPKLPSADFQSVDSDDFETVTVHYEAAEVDPWALDAVALEKALREAVGRQRLALEELSALLSQAVSLPPERMRELARMIVREEPDWEALAPVRALVETCGLAYPSVRHEVVALQALQQLARDYVPYAPPLQGVASVTTFAVRLDEVLATLFGGVAAMQHAYRAETDGPRSLGPEPRALAARLLDWTRDSTGVDELREEVGGMVGHHRRLVAEALGGIDEVLRALRPSSIEQDARVAWPFSGRRLWRRFVERYEEVRRDRARSLGPTLVSVAEALGLMRGFVPYSSPQGRSRAMQILPA